jgi:hypothetical protein
MKPVSVAMVLCLGGCSFALVQGPPSNHEQLPYVPCTEGRLGPVLDTVWTALQGLNLAVAVSSSDSEWDDVFGGSAPLSRSAAIPLYVGLAGLGAAGMYYGFTRTSACRSARARAALRGPGEGGPGQPGSWPPPAPQAPSEPPPPAPEPSEPPPPAPEPSEPGPEPEEPE